MKTRRKGCTFCREDFPYDYQMISDDPEYWFFLSNIAPQCDFHCLLVLKAKVVDRIGHISNVYDGRLPDKAVAELGLLLKKASMAIRKCDPQIVNIFLISLNTGKATKHLHFHLIPRRKGEKVKRVNNPADEGGGMFFIGRKEIVVDTFQDFLRSTTHDASNELLQDIAEATQKRVTRNTRLLKRHFVKIWNLDNRVRDGN